MVGKKKKKNEGHWILRKQGLGMVRCPPQASVFLSVKCGTTRLWGPTRPPLSGCPEAGQGRGGLVPAVARVPGLMPL